MLKRAIMRLALLLFFAVSSAGFAQQAQSPRTVTALSTGWRFQYGDAAETVKTAAFDDSAWEQVSVPHTWNRVGEYALTRSPATNNKQGIGWYRLNYDAKPMAKGRRMYIDFAAVGNIADVWINGAHVGQHNGAFTRFRFDVTPQWKPGAKNLIVVRADNSKPAVGSSTEHVIPLTGDFFIHGGLYRGVQLIEANDVGIDLLDFGGPGVYVETDSVENAIFIQKNQHDITEADEGFKAKISVRTKVRNGSASNVKLRATASIVCTSCKLPYSKPAAVLLQMPSKSVNVGAGEIAAIPMSLDLNLHWLYGIYLWSGIDNPYLLSVKLDLFAGRRLQDSITVPIGIRSFKFDPNTGLTLNGKPLKLRGVSRHQDRLGKGWALSAKDHAEDMALMKEMGVNSVRHAHYPHADEWVEEADRAGMIVWAEVPYVTTPSLSGGEGSAEIFANAEQQTRELIRQNYNHPSIAMWAAGNEVDASALFGLTSAPTRPRKLLDHINRIIKEEDPSRASVFADCCEDVRSPVAGLAAQEQGEKLAGATDLIGYNRYYGWYYPEPLKVREQLGREMDKLHAKHPTLPISISEYGAGGAFGQHSDNVMTGFINATGRPQPEDYESWVHEQSWPVIRDRPYIFGSWVWNMFDFASDLRNEGDSVDINTKGLVSFDRKVKKDAFFYYKAQWSDQRMVHITSKRHRNRPYPVMDVRAYTTAKRAILKLNGMLIGEATCADRICVWPNVILKPGQNVADVELPDEKIEPDPNSSWDPDVPRFLTDVAVFYGPDPIKDGIHLDAGDVAGRILGTRRFGSDNFVTGGSPAVLNQGGFGGRGAAKKIVTAPDPALYDYYREGEAFSYAIPVPDGQWTVTIHSFETRAANAGTMSVTANGKLLVKPFSVAKEAGGVLKGVTKSFPVAVKGGVLKLDFSGQGGLANVAAIEIIKR